MTKNLYIFQKIVQIAPKDFEQRAVSYHLLYSHFVTTDSKCNFQILDKTEIDINPGFFRGW